MIKKMIILVLLLNTGSILSDCYNCVHKKVARMNKTVHAMSNVCQLFLKAYKAETNLFEQVLDWFNLNLQSLLTNSNKNVASAQELCQFITYIVQDQNNLEEFLSKINQEFCQE